MLRIAVQSKGRLFDDTMNLFSRGGHQGKRLKAHSSGAGK